MFIIKPTISRLLDNVLFCLIEISDFSPKLLTLFTVHINMPEGWSVVWSNKHANGRIEPTDE